MALRVGLKLSGQGTTVEELRAVWQIADAGGFDHCWNFDHFAALGADPELDIFEAWTMLGAMAEALFGSGQQSWAWARKMQKLLLKPGGVGRVLHSAAALRGRVKPRGQRLADFRRAYKYLQARRKHLRYAEYRRLGLPIGVQIVARPWREDVALAVAKHLETVLGGWERPSL